MVPPKVPRREKDGRMDRKGPLKIFTSSLLNKFCLFVVFDFLMWAIFNVFVEFVMISLLFFCFGFLAPRHV